MSTAALQANAFYNDASANGAVFTLVQDDSFLVLRINASDVVPFWSSSSRVERVRQEHPKYGQYEIDEITLSDFLEKTLPLLESEGIRVGVNWAGPRLTGYDVAVSDIRANIAHYARREG